MLVFYTDIQHLTEALTVRESRSNIFVSTKHTRELDVLTDCSLRGVDMLLKSESDIPLHTSILLHPYQEV